MSDGQSEQVGETEPMTRSGGTTPLPSWLAVDTTSQEFDVALQGALALDLASEAAAEQAASEEWRARHQLWADLTDGEGIEPGLVLGDRAVFMGDFVRSMLERGFPSATSVRVRERKHIRCRRRWYGARNCEYEPARYRLGYVIGRARHQTTQREFDVMICDDNRLRALVHWEFGQAVAGSVPGGSWVDWGYRVTRWSLDENYGRAATEWVSSSPEAACVRIAVRSIDPRSEHGQQWWHDWIR